MSIQEVIQASPIFSLLLISFLITVISTLIHKKLTNQAHLKTLKKRQKEIQKEIRSSAKDKNPKVLQELNAEMLQLTGVMFKASLRPMIVTIVPFLLLFAWLRGVYTPLLGPSWFWYYIGSSIVSSIVLRKALKMA